MSWKRFCKTSWKRFEDVLKMSWRCLEDAFAKRLENVLKTSWRRIAKTNILILTNTSWRDVFWRQRRFHQDECLVGSVLKNVSKLTDKHKRQSQEAVFSGFSFLIKLQTRRKPETFRSSHWKCSVKQGAFKNFANFTGNSLCWSLFLIKSHFGDLQIYHRSLWYRCFPVKFEITLKNICECLLVNFI